MITKRERSDLVDFLFARRREELENARVCANQVLSHLEEFLANARALDGEELETRVAELVFSIGEARGFGNAAADILEHEDERREVVTATVTQSADNPERSR